MKIFTSYLMIASCLFAREVFEINATITWLLCISVIIYSVRKSNPFNPTLWLFVAWGVLFSNFFSGVMYVPSHLQYSEPVIYIVLCIVIFHIGYNEAKDKNIKFNKYQVNLFLSKKSDNRFQYLYTVLGLLSLIGALFICLDIFFLQGLSINGGERRGQLQDLQFSAFATSGMIFLGGAYLSALSLFFGGNKRNQVIGILSFISLALSSMALAGKQGVLIAILICIYAISISKFFKIPIKVPFFTKLLLSGTLLFFIYYIILLSSERHGNVTSGQLLDESLILNSSFKNDMSILPNFVKNTFAEFFGYYGEQLGTFIERWEIDNYVSKYSIIEIPPRILGPFTWLERQLIKIFPGYVDLYQLKDWVKTIQKQKNGYYGLANWQTTVLKGVKDFGFLGQLIIIFFHGYISRKLYQRIGSQISLSTLHMSMFNNIFIVYTIMMNFLGETSAFFYVIIILLIYRFEKRSFLNEKRNATLKIVYM
ncbi:hypothetical protein [Runella zeae]|uniref:hypothetical protein n=1 Tax=Runella zeae TaxID=94255 RepID=UPI002357B265|nr:hypothetical protein [Runella zeae]